MCSNYLLMMLGLFLFSIQIFESFKVNALRREYPIEIKKQSSRMKIKNNEDSWYFVHFNSKPDYSLLSKKGININPKNMINTLWYSLFLTSSQANELSKYAYLREVDQKEKIINNNLIKYSEFLQIETSSTFDSSKDIKSFTHENPNIYKISDNLYQISSKNNQKLAQKLSKNAKIYLITPKNGTLHFNNRAAGFTQFNTLKAKLSGKSNDVITIDRVLEAKGLNGEGQVILVQDTYLDPNSTFFYDPNHQNFQKNHYYDDHRKIAVIFDDFDYKTPRKNEHGTHVAGCAAGASHLSSSESDLPLYDGTAPKAKISFYQGGTSGLYTSANVKNIVDKTHPSVCTNSWGYRQQSMADDNEWNRNAKEMNETLFMFAAGNFGHVNNPTLDHYETLTSPGAGKNLLTVGATSSVPIDEKDESGKTVIDDSHKRIYFFHSESQQTYWPNVKAWSLKSEKENPNPGADYLFSEGSVELKLTYDASEDFSANKKVLIINDKAAFDALDKKNPPFVVLTPADFEVDNFETLGFSHLFPVVQLDNESITILYNNYGHSVEVETNYVSSELNTIHRAPFSSKGLSQIGLMKPEIVSPGTAMISARSDPTGPFGHADIAIMDGTSMAAPNVAGATALVSQYFVQKRYRSSRSITPSGTLLRSVLINAADPLDKDKPYPDADVGFGVLNLGNYILTGNTRDGDDEFVLVGDHIKVEGEQHLLAEIDVKDKSRDLRITISYLDEVLSDDSSAALAIDLDLIVIAPDKTTLYRGNQRPDDTEEMFSTNERVIIKKENLAVGKYEIHIISHIPDVVPTKSTEFSISIFGPITYTKGDMITFEKAKTCIPISGDHGECNEETTLNECKFDDYGGYVGHSCQNDVVILIEEGKALFELEPFGVKYVNVYYPLDAEFASLTVSITSATPFLPKYAYTLNTTGLKHPMRELDAENVQMNSDVSVTITNHGQVQAWEATSCIYSMIYNKSPKKTTFIVGYNVVLPDTPTKPISPLTSAPSSPVTPQTQTPTEQPTKTSDEQTTVKVEKVVDSYFVPFIIVIVSCFILFAVVIFLAIYIKKSGSKKDEFVSESLKTSLF